ncbi:MAG TPA: integrase, partial [Methanofollis liminatans]|nr:integrase [Methanofollis liminatans]
MAKIVSFGKTAEELEMYAERGIRRRIDAGDMAPEDADLIRQFVAHQRANGNIGDARAYKTANSLSNLTRFCKTPLAKNKIGDIYLAVTAIKRGKKIAAKNGNNGGGTLSPDTQRDYITFLKRFYLWMIEEGYIDLPANKIAKIKVPAAKRMTKTAEQMLTEDEIRAMIHSCANGTAIRDRALISVLYESAMRIHEVAALKWSDVQFDTHFVKINTAGKTGTPRYIPLTASRGYLAEWRGAYPGDATGESHVFITNRKKTLTYNYTARLLQRIAERAGIQKHITPH